MGLFASKKDDKDAYRKKEGMVGRSIRRGTDKALKALTFGAISGDPGEYLAKDAAKEAATKAIPRSRED